MPAIIETNKINEIVLDIFEKNISIFYEIETLST
jgi:hypothetical protein